MAPKKIQKRNGKIVQFDVTKIEEAIAKAVLATDSEESVDVAKLSAEVSSLLDRDHTKQPPREEHIQDYVEDVLIRHDHEAVAKAYILYRQKRSEDRADQNVMVDVEHTMEEYLSQADWRVNENANQGYSVGGMILNTSGKVTANYWLSHIYPKAVGQAHRNADMHIHDLSMFTGYCAGWSLRALLEEGFNGVPGTIESGPPKHLSSAVAQMINFLGTLQNEWAGAQAFSSLDTYLAPFVKKKELELLAEIKKHKISFSSKKKKEEYIEESLYDYVFQNMQSFIFNLNIPSRWGTQTPFTNVTLDWDCPNDMKEKKLLLGGKAFSHSFGQLQKEMDMINKAFIAVMMAGDAKGRTFTFPIPTYNITKDFAWDDEKTQPLFEMTAKYGTPYFQNFINSDLDPGDVRSMCCRLQLDLKELRRRGGGLFGSAEMTGSIGVVTLNLGRLGYTCAGDKKKLFKEIDHLMELAKTSLEIKRKVVQKWLDRGLFPFTKRYLGQLNNHFSTIGVNGLNEAIRNFSGDKENIASEYGQTYAMEILEHMRDRLSEFQEKTGNLYNLEATPGEGTTYRFAKEDQKRFEGILQAGTDEAPYYTNSSQLPVGYTDDVFEALELQDDLQALYTGGTVLHCYMSERISSGKACAGLVKKILTRFRLPYITITPTFSICPKHGYLKGEHDYCPQCDEEIGYTGDDHMDQEVRTVYESQQADR